MFLASLSPIHIFIEHLCDRALMISNKCPPFSHVEAYLILRCSTPLLCQAFHLKAYSQAFVPLYMHSTLRVKMNT